MAFFRQKAIGCFCLRFCNLLIFSVSFVRYKRKGVRGECQRSVKRSFLPHGVTFHKKAKVTYLSTNHHTKKHMPLQKNVINQKDNRDKRKTTNTIKTMLSSACSTLSRQRVPSVLTPKNYIKRTVPFSPFFPLELNF